MMNINILWHIFQLVIFIWYSAFFAYRVFEEHLKVSKKDYWIRVAVYTVALTIDVCLFLTELSPWQNLRLVGMLLVFLFTLAVYKSFTDKKLIFLLFVLFILVNVQLVSLLLSQATLEFHILPVMFAYENGDFLFWSAIYGSISFWIIYSSLVKFYKRTVDEDIVLAQTRQFFWLPFLFFVIIEIIYHTTFKDSPEIRKDMFLPLILLNVFAFTAYYAALKSMNDNFDATMEREKLLEAESRLNLWETQYESLQGKVAADAKARHDWRQHIITIMGFVEKKDLNGLDRYLSDYKAKYLIEDMAPVCDIPALNMLFQYYQRQAEERGITLSIGTAAFEDSLISVSELTILFGNLLENAIEACERVTGDEKYIKLKIVKDKNKIILLCENSFDGYIQRRGDTIKSRKSEGGIGLTSVQDIVEKYNGYLKIKTERNIFEVYAYLQDMGRKA